MKRLAVYVAALLIVTGTASAQDKQKATLLNNIAGTGASAAVHVNYPDASNVLAFQAIYTGATVTLESSIDDTNWQTAVQTWDGTKKILTAPVIGPLLYRVNVTANPGAVVFTGGGLNDLTSGGTYSGLPAVYDVVIDHNPLPATGSITCVAKSALLDGETVTISDGTNPASVFEFDVPGDGSGVKSSGSITCVAKSSLVDGETVTLNDGVNPATVFEFDLAGDGSGIKSTGTIVCVPTANLIDGETVTLNDGVNPATVFEFDKAGDGVVGGNVQVNVSTDTTAVEVAARLHAAINGVVAGLAITSTDPLTGTLNLKNDAVGAYNAAVVETVADAGFVVTGMTGGVAATAGRVAVNVSADTTAIQVAARLHSAINGVGAGLAITSTDGLAGTLTLANDAVGAYNAAISDTVAAAGFTHTGMSGGAALVGTNVVVNVSADTTAAQVAARLHSAINGVVGGLTVTSTDAGGGVLNLAADAADTTHNVAITKTVANSGFAITGMSGGTAVDSFKWRKAGGTWTNAVLATAGAHTLSTGQTVTLAATTGHTVNDAWAITQSGVTVNVCVSGKSEVELVP